MIRLFRRAITNDDGCRNPQSKVYVKISITLYETDSIFKGLEDTSFEVKHNKNYKVDQGKRNQGKTRSRKRQKLVLILQVFVCTSISCSHS